MNHRFFSATLAFFSAALLFGVQPHWGRRLAPVFGGGPAVWNACLVFFQATLLLGYDYAFRLLQCDRNRAAAVHTAVLAAACGWLFIVPATLVYRPGDAPTLQAIATLSFAVGLPAATLSATAPLIHRWSASDGGTRRGYGVYAASNAGSLAALLCYPMLVEPNLGLDAQWTFWRVGFLAFSAAMILLGWRPLKSLVTPPGWRTVNDPFSTPGAALERATHQQGGRSELRMAWLFWSALPSLLLVSATQRITEDVAGGPLLWLPPLALFLFASILAFAGRSPPLAAFAWSLPAVLLLRGTALALIGVAPTFSLRLAVELTTLFAACWCAFSILYALRPIDAESSAFYRWLALGGALGGGFASLAAPHLFHSTAEHPLGLLLLCLFLPIPSKSRRPILEAIVLAAALLLAVAARSEGGEAPALEALLLAGGFTTLLALAARRSPAFGLALAVPLAAALTFSNATSDRAVVAALRSEFGCHRVVVHHDESGALYHSLRHGAVVHGWQCREPGRMMERLGYYHPSSPVGAALAWRRESAGDVAVLGLGAGATLSCRGPSQHFIFFEIDPVVVQLASHPRYFSYLAEAGDDAEVRIGDGRLKIALAADGAFATILLDAFSGDAVPTHLLTREAFATYLRKLRPDGVLLVHISNWFVGLEGPVAKVAEDVGLAVVGKDQPGGRNDLRPGPAASHCLALARDERLLSELLKDEGWRPVKAPPGTKLWTDDYCDLWSVLRWRGR